MVGPRARNPCYVLGSPIFCYCDLRFVTTQRRLGYSAWVGFYLSFTVTAVSDRNRAARDGRRDAESVLGANRPCGCDNLRMCSLGAAATAKVLPWRVACDQVPVGQANRHQPAAPRNPSGAGTWHTRWPLRSARSALPWPNRIKPRCSPTESSQGPLDRTKTPALWTHPLRCR